MVDASAFGEYLLRTELGLQVETIIEAPDSEMNVPAFCDLELCSIFRRLSLGGAITRDNGIDLLSRYVRLPIARHSHIPLLARVLELGDNFTAYDASYVALAERLDALLITCDRRMTSAAKRFTNLNVVGVTS